jgi:hypothetical protein
MFVCFYELLFQFVNCYNEETRKVSKCNVLQLQRWTRHQLSSLRPAKGRSVNVPQLSPQRSTPGEGGGCQQNQVPDPCTLLISEKSV